MAITLYYMPGSAPCQAVRMGAKAFGLELELKLTNLQTGENRTPEFIKMNPLHTIPTLDDNGFYLADSRGVLQYFANAYGKDDSLYPKDPKKRAIVDQRFLFDLGVLYKAFADAYYVIFAQNKPEAKNIETLNEKLGFLETYLSQTKYSAADHLTIADFSIVATLNTFELVGHDLSKFPKTVKYLEKCRAEIKDYKEVNDKDLAVAREFFQEALKKVA